MIKNRIIYNPAIDWRFNLSKAKGSFLWDDSGKKYIDFSSGWNTANLGWNNKEIVNTIVNQARKNVYAPMWSADLVQIEYANALTKAFSEELDVVARATGGTEANEIALKIARAVTGRSKIVSFSHTYHGQSFGTLALGFIPDYVKAIAPLVPEFIQLNYPNAFDEEKSEKEVLSIFLHDLEKKLKTEDVAAVFTEAGLITGWGSMLVAPNNYLTEIRRITKKYGTLLIVDEVGTGFSRTGKLFAIEHENVVPDMVTLAKGISNGAMPIGAVVTKSKLVEKYIGLFKPTSTFGWTPLACAVALKTLQLHQKDEVWKEAERKGNFVKAMLKKKFVNNSNIKNIRGKGLEIAFSVDNLSSDDIINEIFRKGLHLADAGDSITIMPPLVIEEKVLETGLDILVEVINKLS